MRYNIFHLPVMPSCRLCGRHDETIDHLIGTSEVIALSIVMIRWQECCIVRIANCTTAKLWNHKPLPMPCMSVCVEMLVNFCGILLLWQATIFLITDLAMFM